MGRYIAFLRGINVGGNNKVSMPELKAIFERNGFREVVTYINSGNIIFSSDISDFNKLKETCEAFIADELHLNIAVAIVSADELSKALKHAPEWWDLDKESKHNALIVIPPVTVAEVFEAVGAAKPEYEKVGHFGNVVFWSAPLATFSRTRWSRVVKSSVYGSMTIRNANTVKKLVELAGNNQA